MSKACMRGDHTKHVLHGLDRAEQALLVNDLAGPVRSKQTARQAMKQVLQC